MAAAAQVLAAQGFVIAPVPADGDCLFHALAMHEDGDAAALRMEVTDYLEQEAMSQEAPYPWLEEAANLRGNQWATHTTICGYALMQKRQVIVHKLDERTQAHNTLSLLDQDVDTGGHEPIHIWYNGTNHYEGIVHSSGVAPETSGVSRDTEDFPPLSRCIGASPKKRQRRFVMEPSIASPAPSSAPQYEPPNHVPVADAAPPCRTRYTRKRPPMQADLSKDVLTRSVVRKKCNTNEPLVWLLHGPPGTGKSHVLPLLRDLFDNVLGYTQGIEYQITAFQAVNAADIRGKTIHHAFGLNVNMHAGDDVASRETAKRLAHLRWLIIDEISM
eukprot:6487632-Amphidinium_carterae.4